MTDAERLAKATALLAPFVKHPGAHNQKVHGRGGGGLAGPAAAPAEGLSYEGIKLAPDPGSKVKLGSGPVVSHADVKVGDLVDVTNRYAPKSSPQRVWVVGKRKGLAPDSQWGGLGPYSGQHMKFLAPKHRVPPPGGVSGRKIYDLGFNPKTETFMVPRQWTFHRVSSP